MNVRRRLVVWLAALALAGCAGRVEAPAAPASRAAASTAGVEIAAVAGAWRGWPGNLDRVLTPIHLRLANRGAVGVRVDVTTLALALPGGGRLAAVLPADLHGIPLTPQPSALPDAGLTLGPTRERSGPGWAVNDPQPDPRSDPAQEADRVASLPSADMLALALPEGVLPPGQMVSGFVYFERAPRGAAGLQLRVPIVDAGSGETLDVAALPLTLP
jgi:hypothetical protein